MNVVSGSMKTLSIIATLLLVLAFSYASYSTVYAAQSADYVEGQLIIKLKPRLANGVLQNLLNQNRLSQIKSIPRLNTIVVRVPAGFLLDTFEKILARNANVEFVEKNYMRYATISPNDTHFNLQYHHPRIQDNQAWDINTGSSNVVIAVVDSGVQSNHPDLSGKVLPGRNLVGSTTSTNSEDDNGHGTGVAGTAAAKSNNAAGVAGVCWGCQILPVKVLNSAGSGSLGDVLEGIAYVASYADANPTKKVIMNLSLGGGCSLGSIEQNAINDAWNSGVLIIAAAGNKGNNTAFCPAARTNVIAVSATDQTDKLATFSTFGSFLDVSAPGVDIVTTWRNSGYVSVDGTSFASPVTSGLAGLIWSINPNLTNTQVAQLIRDTADDIGAQGFDTSFGYGRVNAFTAAQAARATLPAPVINSTPTPTPVATPTPTPKPSTSPTPTPTATPVVTPTPTPTPVPTPTPTPVAGDSKPPTVVITSPANGTSYIGGAARAINVSASDNVGVVKVRFVIDGTVRGTDTTAPYSLTWIPSIGTHTIRAIASDAVGNSAYHQISVRRLF